MVNKSCSIDLQSGGRFLKLNGRYSLFLEYYKNGLFDNIKSEYFLKKIENFETEYSGDKIESFKEPIIINIITPNIYFNYSIEITNVIDVENLKMKILKYPKEKYAVDELNHRYPNGIIEYFWIH